MWDDGSNPAFDSYLCHVCSAGIEGSRGFHCNEGACAEHQLEYELVTAYHLCEQCAETRLERVTARHAGNLEVSPRFRLMKCPKNHELKTFSSYLAGCGGLFGCSGPSSEWLPPDVEISEWTCSVCESLQQSEYADGEFELHQCVVCKGLALPFVLSSEYLLLTVSRWQISWFARAVTMIVSPRFFFFFFPLHF